MSLFARIKLWVYRIIPRRALSTVLPAYHFMVALLGAALYGFPSRRLVVVGVTGTKGKSSTTEYVNAVFEAAGKRTAVLNSIRRKVSDHSRANTMRMSMPGRFYLQAFFDEAVRAGCDVAIIEMTSEGARQYRHRGIALDCLIFTNLAPEHIESHGSFEAYANAKYELGLQLARSHKRPRIMVANADDAAAHRFLTLPVEHALPYALSTAPHEAGETRGWFEFEDLRMEVPQSGTFSLENALAAATAARALGVVPLSIQEGLARVERIPGRGERIEAGQDFVVVVDYAHTIESQKAIYEAYAGRRKICVLGSCGGGRDTWVRPRKGATAEAYCDHVILTNEDPYDEDPRTIIDQIASGMTRTPEIILDRREAIARACAQARAGDAVIITGKGTDPTIQGPRGTSIPWSDAQVAREALEKQRAA